MRCVVPTCNHDSNSSFSQGITFHKFPADPSLCATWLKAINKQGWNPDENSSVCSYHFLINDLYLSTGGLCKIRESAVPMLFIQDVPKTNKSLIPCDVKVCRICFSTNSHLYSMKLFKNLHQAYETLTGLVLEHDDNKPPYLCSECSHKLMNSFSFRNKILESHLTLQEILRIHDCITLESINCSNENENLFNSHLDTTQNPKYHYNVKIEHVKNENIEPDEQENPMDLPTSYDNAIIEDIKMEKDDNMSNQDSPKNLDISQDIVYSPSLHKYIVCDGLDVKKEDAYNPDCLNYQDTTNYDMVHSNAFEGKCQGLTCYATKVIFGFFYDSLCDTFFLPNIDENYSVDACQNVEGEEETEKNTVGIIKNLMKMPKNLTHTSLNNHSETFMEADPGFIVNDKLSLDTRCESIEKPFTCDICNKSFCQKSWLVNHAKIHSGDRPYSCDLCKRRFNDKSNYRKHLRIHSGEKPYPCIYCDKAFNRKNYLENHLRTHSGEKPYSCDICYKVFGHKHHLKSHLRVHSGEKPYSCHICNKEFSEKSNLHMHLKVHSGAKLYSCEECKIAFSTKYLLKCHSRTH